MAYDDDTDDDNDGESVDDNESELVSGGYFR
jgi:hypothetical protein